MIPILGYDQPAREGRVRMLDRVHARSQQRTTGPHAL